MNSSKPEATTSSPAWTPDALERLERAPVFLRGMVKRLAEKKAGSRFQGFDLFGKPMQLAFAKTRSDAFVKRTAGDEELESHKRRRLAEKGMLSLCWEEAGSGLWLTSG